MLVRQFSRIVSGVLMDVAMAITNNRTLVIVERYIGGGRMGFEAV